MEKPLPRTYRGPHDSFQVPKMKVRHDADNFKDGEAWHLRLI